MIFNGLAIQARGFEAQQGCGGDLALPFTIQDTQYILVCWLESERERELDRETEKRE